MRDYAVAVFAGSERLGKPFTPWTRRTASLKWKTRLADPIWFRIANCQLLKRFQDFSILVFAISVSLGSPAEALLCLDSKNGGEKLQAELLTRVVSVQVSPPHPLRMRGNPESHASVPIVNG